MSITQQIPRNALVWIIICLFAVVAPHALRIPLWVMLVYVVAALWRIMVYRGRWSYPGRVVKVVMTVTSFLGIFFKLWQYCRTGAHCRTATNCVCAETYRAVAA